MLLSKPVLSHCGHCVILLIEVSRCMTGFGINSAVCLRAFGTARLHEVKPVVYNYRSSQSFAGNL